MLYLLGLASLFILTSTHADDLDYTWEEAAKAANYTWKAPAVETEFLRWVHSAGIDPNKAWLAKFRIGAAQEYAESFCKAERNAKGLRCTWPEYQWLVNYMLLPFEKAFNHGHLEGTATETAVHEQLPTIAPCTEFNGVPTAIQFMNLVAASKPVVFKGAVRDWPAVKSWTSAGLAARLPNVEWSVAVSRNGEFDSVEPIEMWLPPLEEEGHRNESVMVDPSGKILHAVSTKPVLRAQYALARPAKVKLSTNQFFRALVRSPTSQPQFPEGVQLNPRADAWDVAFPYLSNAPYVYVEYMELARIKADIAAANLDPKESLFKDFGPAFDRKRKPEAQDGFSDLRFADFLVPSTRLLWLGTGGTVGNLHFDRQVLSAFLRFLFAVR
jgi:hypothetical protein